MIEAALITARGGSVGLPGKNIRPLGGAPLIAWTVRAALRSNVFERVVVSTDSSDIANAASDAGAETPFIRPAELASSQARSIDVIDHAIATLNIQKNFALLQPTSPFRNAQIIQEAAEQFSNHNGPSLFSVSASKPMAWTYQMAHDGCMLPLSSNSEKLFRRQDSAPLYAPNGAMYFCTTEAFANTQSLFHDQSLGFALGAIDSLDIDTLEDFELAEAVVASNLRKIDA